MEGTTFHCPLLLPKAPPWVSLSSQGMCCWQAHPKASLEPLLLSRVRVLRTPQKARLGCEPES